MKRGIRAAMLAAVAGLGALAPLALAQGSTAADRIFMSNRNDGWTTMLLSKDCYLISFIDGLISGWGGYDDMNKLRVTTSGAATHRASPKGPCRSSTNGRPNNGPVRVVNDGTARNGLLQGMAKQTIYDQYDTPGRFTIADLGDARNPMPSFFRNGCEFFVDGEGRIDFENPSTSGPYGQCLPEGGQFLLNAADPARIRRRFALAGPSRAAATTTAGRLRRRLLAMHLRPAVSARRRHRGRSGPCATRAIRN